MYIYTHIALAEACGGRAVLAASVRSGDEPVNDKNNNNNNNDSNDNNNNNNT